MKKTARQVLENCTETHIPAIDAINGYKSNEFDEMETLCAVESAMHEYAAQFRQDLLPVINSIKSDIETHNGMMNTEYNPISINLRKVLRQLESLTPPNEDEK